jgi:hypothetical protein
MIPLAKDSERNTDQVRHIDEWEQDDAGDKGMEFSIDEEEEETA